MSSDTAEVKLWLQTALRRENLVDFTVTLQGNSGKGEGYMGDIVFVSVSGETHDHSQKNYNMALKCSKKNEELRKAMPVKENFLNEIYFYETIVPAFRQFQKEKGVVEVSCVPKFYGSFVSENMEVVVLENLNACGYRLLDKRKPMPSGYLKLILEQYGKWHAVSAAMQDQKPEMFDDLAKGMKKVWKLFLEVVNPEEFFGPPVQEVYEVVEDCLDVDARERFRTFKSQICEIFDVVRQDNGYFSVIAHTDCWINNFMFQNEKVAILDWQVATFCSPVASLSYFIHSCASEEDLGNFETLLKHYYDSFSSHVRLLGSDPEKIFPFTQLLEDFKILAKYGILMTMLVTKVALGEKEETVDFAETVAGGLENSFTYKNRDSTLLKNRMLYIIKHTVKYDFL